MWLGQVQGIAVDVEYHVAVTVAYTGIRVGGTVVKLLDGGFSGGHGAFGLGGAEGAEGDQEGGVYRTGIIVQECTYDLLESQDPLGW